MDFRCRDYYIVRKNKYTFNDYYIDHIKDFYPVKVKTKHYYFGNCDSSTYNQNGLYTHLVSIKKEYSRNLENFMNDNKLQYVHVFTEPKEATFQSRYDTTLRIVLRWKNMKQEADMLERQCSTHEIDNHIDNKDTPTKIEYMKISSVDLSTEDYGCLVMRMWLENEGKIVLFGNAFLGRGYLGAESFEGSEFGTEYIMRVMDVVGVSSFNDMVGKYVRVEANWGKTVDKIGNATKDKWFSQKEFFSKASDNDVNQH